MRNGALLAALAIGAAAIAGCGGGGGASGYRPVNPDAAVFWDRQTTETAALLQDIVTAFNAQYDGMPIRVERAGGYEDIHRKVLASLRAGVVPALAVGYPNTTMEYVRADAVVALDEFIHDPAHGFTEADLADFYPATLEMNRYPQFGGRMYSFPFAKSVLMLYFNRAILRAAGIEAPPATWDEFLAQCRQVKEKTGKYAYAIDVDCSTFNGMMLSMGGEVYADGQTLYDSPAAVRAFRLYQTLAREGVAYQIAGGYDDDIALTQGAVAFTMRSSAASSGIADVMKDRMDEWGMARIPQDDPARPATVLYGPNFVLFKTTPEQQRAAWAFIKYFTSVENSARWTLDTGYLPVRKAAAAHPEVQRLWAEKPYRKVTFECLPFARPEPNAPGWHEVRDLVERALADVIAGRLDAEAAAARLKRDADTALQERK